MIINQQASQFKSAFKSAFKALQENIEVNPTKQAVPLAIFTQNRSHSKRTTLSRSDRVAYVSSNLVSGTPEMSQDLKRYSGRRHLIILTCVQYRALHLLHLRLAGWLQTRQFFIRLPALLQSLNSWFNSLRRAKLHGNYLMTPRSFNLWTAP